MLALLEQFFIQFGYLAVFFVLILCGFGIPIPEDVTLVAGGVISGLGYTDVHIMAVVGMAGVLAGDGIMFLLGRHYGDRLLRFKPVARLLNPKRYAQVQQKFDRYGNRVLFVARFLPGLRSPMFLAAGMSRKISFWRWLAMDGLAAALSVPVWVYLGDFGAENKDWLLKQIHRFQFGLYAVCLIGGAWLGWRMWRKRRQLLARRDELLEKRRQRRLARRQNQQS
nr:DedA family protein [uncultured Kingella sp.]